MGRRTSGRPCAPAGGAVDWRAVSSSGSIDSAPALPASVPADPGDLAARHFPRNLAAMVGFDVVWSLGAPCIVTGTMVPAYLYFHGASKTLVQCVMTAMGVLGLLQVLSGKVCHGPQRRLRQYFLWMAFPLGWLALGLLGVFTHGQWPASTWILLLLGACVVQQLANDLAGPAYWDLTLAMTPLRRRGLMAAVRTVIGCAVGLGGAALANYLMKSQPAPANFHRAFIVGPLLMIASCNAVLFMRDVEEDRPARRAPRVRHSMRRLAVNGHFRVFLVCYAFQVAAGCVMPLQVTFGREFAGMSDNDIGYFTLAGFSGSILVAPLVQLLADRHGFRLLAVLSSGAAALAWAACALFGASLAGLLVSVAVVSGAATATAYLLGNLGGELAPRVAPSMVVSLGGLLAAAPAWVLSPLTGLLADRLGKTGYVIAFAGAGALALIAMLGYLLLVREPRGRAAR